MVAAISLVQPTAHTENFMSRIFTEEFAARLEALNRVARELRAMGYRTVSEHIGEENDTPIIEVEPGTQRTAAPLVALGNGKLMARQPDGSRVCSINRDGVRVIWREIDRPKAEAV